MRLARVLLLALTLPLAAQEWLGSQDVGPAPGRREHLTMTSSAHGHLAVWVDLRTRDRSGLFAARIAADGTLLDPEGIHIGNGYRRPVAASDGEDYLILWDTGGARVSATGGVQRFEFQAYVVQSLSWTGRHYLLIADDRMVLLDRDGRVVSGAIKAPWFRYRVASTPESTLVVWIDDFRALGLLLRESDFPPAGSVRSMTPTLSLGSAQEIVLASNGRWFVALRQPRASRSFLLERYTAAGVPFLRASAVTFPDHTWLAEWSMVAADWTIHVAYTVNGMAKLFRVGASGATEVPFAPGVAAIAAGGLGSAGGSVLATWLDARDGGQVYAARLNRDDAGTLVSASKALQTMPRIAASRRGSLAAWVEVGRGYEVVVQPLSADGKRLLQAPLRFAAPHYVEELRIASDGRGRFLVVWSARLFAFDRDSAVRALLVNEEGRVIREPFDVFTDVTYGQALFSSAVWTGSEFLVLSSDRAFRLSRDGMPAAEPQELGDDAELDETWLAWDGTALAGFGFRVNGCGHGGCPLALYVVKADIDLARRENDWILTDFFATVIHPAVAAGGGHALAVVFHENSYLVLGTHRSKVKYGPGFHRPHAIWNGQGFYVSAGPILGVHDADGTLLETRTLHADSLESALTSRLALMSVVVNGQARVAVMPF